jgi:hypothetical protein
MGVFQLLLISNIVCQHCPPDHGIHCGNDGFILDVTLMRAPRPPRPFPVPILRQRRGKNEQLMQIKLLLMLVLEATACKSTRRQLFFQKNFRLRF